jgi:hypothetical protein
MTPEVRPGEDKRFRKGNAPFRAALLVPALARAVQKLDPRTMSRNPVMFITELGALLTTLVTLSAALQGNSAVGYYLTVSAWLWLTVWFANFSEAVAEARGRAQADSLRRARRDVTAHRLVDRAAGPTEDVPAAELRTGDVVRVHAQEIIPADGGSSRASPQWTNPPSPARAPRSSARVAATVRPSPAARACSRITWSSASPPGPGKVSWSA